MNSQLFIPYQQSVDRYTLKMPPLVYKDAGVYALECSKTGKSYIGCSKNMLGRLRAHVGALRLGKHNNGKLQNSWNKYGERAFTFCVLQYTDDIYAREVHWIKVFNTANKGLNLTPGGDGCAVLTPTAVSARREKINKALRTEGNRKKISEWSKKNWKDNYAMMCATRSEAAKRQWADPDMKAKTSAIRKARWAARTSEERAAIMAKAWATRKAKMQ